MTKVAAIIGRGSDADRALAVALAEAGANIALATMEPAQEQDYAMNSIANEVWSIGPEQFVRALECRDATQVTAFAAETWDRFGRCDLLVANHDLVTRAPLDELSDDEFRATVEANLVAPFFAAHAFGRLMARQGSGRVVLIAQDRADGDAAYLAAKAGLEGLARAMTRDWSGRGVFVEAIVTTPEAKELPATLVERLRRT